MEPSKDQIGYKDENGKRVEPTKCAVSGRDCKGKPHITHYGPDDKFVYVLAEVDHLWNEAAPFYGFPVAEEAAPTNEVFDLRKLKKAKPPTETFKSEFASLSPIPTSANQGKRPKPPTIPSEPTKLEGES